MARLLRLHRSSRPVAEMKSKLSDPTSWSACRAAGQLLSTQRLLCRRCWTPAQTRRRSSASPNGSPDFARNVRDHIAALKAKSYWKQFDSAPDFVVMYLPGESFFRAALEQDPELARTASDAQASSGRPATLIAMLRTIASSWREERIAESARAVSDLGRELYERLATHGRACRRRSAATRRVGSGLQPDGRLVRTSRPRARSAKVAGDTV